MKRMIAFFLCALLLNGCAATYDGPTVATPILTEIYSHGTVGGSDVDYVYRYVYAYDIYGNQVRRMDYYNNELDCVVKMRYDDRGNLISRTTWDHNGWIPLPDGRVTYTYDEQDRKLTAVYDNGWGMETERVTYIYDDENRTQTWESSTGDWEITYLDEAGNETRIVHSSGRETVYTYDDRGNRIGKATYENGLLRERWEYRFDEQNRQTYGAAYNADGDLRSDTTCLYDDEAHTQTTLSSDGSKRVEYHHEDGRMHMTEDYGDDGALLMYAMYYYRDIQVPAEEDTP